jgi:protein-S-isoprenylcysteine O-methyltransferase Ste14
MYLGFLLLLLGWAIFLSNLAPFALLPAFVVYMNHFQIRPEERALGSLFAQEYHSDSVTDFLKPPEHLISLLF